ncbi:hypothetical protein Pla110_14990 [Polystyrenella longa]|uniref:Sulfatase n=1 Tax=Polystyrenella longa TaxID=2528007 RepID=A0A518CKM4_9PLAN|nr:DUF1501 domain-containing protein [Polystyrenella longa]QDU79785.1 hypothetical protein Pla110_14990 [Polystyrenella longa]
MTFLPESDFLKQTRRHFLGRASTGLGAAALGSLLQSTTAQATEPHGGVMSDYHHAPKAKRIIYLFMSGGPSQLDLYDYKPVLNERNGEDLPESVRQGQRLTGMSANQAQLPLAGSAFDFQQHGQAGMWMSELLPHTAKMADELCLIKSMHTEAINHDPAITFFQTGSQIAGRPSMGAWLSYGLGSANENLPTFCVLVTKDKGGQPLYARLWGTGFLPSVHEGVQFRAGAEPVLYLKNPAGISPTARRKMLDRLQELHQIEQEKNLDPLIESRIAQYEMAYRMQTSVPEVTDLSSEPDHIFEMYGEDSRTPGTFAANCLLARRLAEQNVQFIQLYHQGWDQHSNLPNSLRNQTKETDQPCAALLQDLKQRGMLDDTIVLWGGEFGRTNYSQGKLTASDYGRDHHPRCFSMWGAGGGFKPGMQYGETDPFGYNVAENPVHVHDLHATLLHLLGIDHERLTYKHQGRRFRLTDVFGDVKDELLA